MSDKYNLKWNSHHADTFSSFNAFRCQEHLVDVTLSCESEVFKAHRLILSSGSRYFKRILQHCRDNTVIHFFGVSARLLKFLIEFIYVGEIEVPGGDLEQFVSLAEALELEGLKKDCSPSGIAWNRPALKRNSNSLSAPGTLKVPKMGEIGVASTSQQASAEVCSSSQSFLLPIEFSSLVYEF